MADVIFASEARKRTERAFHTISDELANKLNIIICHEADNGETSVKIYGTFPPTTARYLANRGYSSHSGWDSAKREHYLVINWKN